MGGDNLNSFKAMFEAVIFLALSGVVWAGVADAAADVNVPAAQVGLYTLVGVVFTIGGLYSIAAAFGMVDPISTKARNFVRR